MKEKARWKFQRDADTASAAKAELRIIQPPVANISRRSPLISAVADAQDRIDRMCGDADDEGYTYAIRQVGADLIKIGQATAPTQRIAEIQRMNGSRLELVGLCHGTAAESILHKEHRPHREHGEWFRLDVNPIPDGELGCWSCSRTMRGGPIQDMLSVYVEVPIRPERFDYMPEATFGRRDGRRHGGWPNPHFEGAALLCDRDQSAAARRLFASSATNSRCYTGPALKFVTRLDRILPRMGLTRGSAVYYWPGLGHRETDDPDEVVKTYRESVAELEAWEVQANEGWMRDWGLLP